VIRYPVPENLPAELDRESKGWTASAAARTRKIVKARRFNDPSPIWSKVKRVYIRLQHGKCAFCEKKLEGADFGAIEHDVEHFRPKSEVKVWPDAAARKRGVAPAFATGPASPRGYYWLAYEPLNYMTACKTCNSVLKSSAFPIAGARAKHNTPVAGLRREKPFLLYPLGTLDDDPESILGFIGVAPTVLPKADYERRRGAIMIDFFALDIREELLRGRAEQISAYWYTRQQAQLMSGAMRAVAERRVAQMIGDKNPHASAVRCFARLCDSEPAFAAQVFEAVTKVLNAES